jgi:hypothetical protein
MLTYSKDALGYVNYEELRREGEVTFPEVSGSDEEL